MSFGNTRKRTDLKAYAFRIKTKDLPVPHFEVQTRENDKWVPLTEPVKDTEGKITGTKVVTAQNIEGNLLAIESRKTVFQGKTIKSTSVTLQDGDQIYFVTIPNSMLGRGILNRLINLKAFTNVQIGLYASKPQSEGEKSFHRASVRQDDEIVNWKYTFEQLPEAPQIKKASGEVLGRDYDALDAFFEKEVAELNSKIKKGAVVAPTPAAVETATATEHVVPESAPTPEAAKEDLNSDIPF